MTAENLVGKYTSLKPAFAYMDAWAQKNNVDPLLCTKIARLQMRACTLIDENIDRPVAEKNTLMAGVIFSFVPTAYLAQDKPEGFGPAIDNIIGEVIAYKNASAGKGSLDVSQIIVAASTAIAEEMLEKLKSGNLNSAQIGDAVRLAEVPKKYPRDMIGISAQRLLSVYTTTGDNLAREIQKKRPSPPKTPSF